MRKKGQIEKYLAEDFGSRPPVDSLSRDQAREEAMELTEVERDLRDLIDDRIGGPPLDRERRPSPNEGAQLQDQLEAVRRRLKELWPQTGGGKRRPAELDS